MWWSRALVVVILAVPMLAIHPVEAGPIYDNAGAVATVISPQLPQPMAGAAIAWTGSIAYVFGGESLAAEFDTIQAYDPAAGTLTTLPIVLPEPSSGISAVWTGSVAYIFGVDSSGPINDPILVFNPAGAGTLTTFPTALPWDFDYGMAVWTGSKAYLFEQENGARAIFEFDPVAATVTELSIELPSGVFGATAVWDANAGVAYLVGGASFPRPTGFNGRQIIRFVPPGGASAGSISVFADVLSVPRFFPAAFWDGLRIYALGGGDCGSECTDIDQSDTIDRFDTTYLVASALTARIPFPIMWPAAFYDDAAGCGHILGGADYDGVTATLHDKIVAFGPPTCHPEEDTDGDGVPNGSDNCVAISNANQLDSDNDGRGDACPIQGAQQVCNPPSYYADTDGDGFPETCIYPSTGGLGASWPNPFVADPPTVEAGGAYLVGELVKFRIVGDWSGGPWKWEFGDGSVGFGNPMQHAFARPGTFTVRLTTNSELSTAALITVRAALPTAGFVWTPGNPLTGADVVFTDRSTSENPLESWTWTFDDGSTATGTVVTHVFQQAGAHTVSLVVREANNGLTAASTQKVNVLDGPVARITAKSSVVSNGTALLDGRASSGPGALRFHWTQTGGPPVKLPDGAEGSFVAPPVESATTLTFSLVVSTDGHDSLPSNHSLVVLPLAVQQKNADQLEVKDPTDRPLAQASGFPAWIAGAGLAAALLAIAGIALWRRRKRE